MSSPMNNASAEAIQQVMTWMAEMKDGVCEQAPLLAEEIVRYGVVVHTFRIVTCLLLLAATAVVAVYVLRRAKKLDEAGKNVAEVLVGTFGGGLALTLAVVAVVNAATLVQVIVAPRLYILSELKNLL